MSAIPRVQDLGTEVEQILSGRIARDNGDVKTIYRVIAQQPDLLRVFCAFSDVLNRGGRLTPAQREVAILRTSFRTGSDYETFFHVARARSAGLIEAEIDQLDQLEYKALRPEYALIVRVADELCESNAL